MSRGRFGKLRVEISTEVDAHEVCSVCCVEEKGLVTGVHEVCSVCCVEEKGLK